MLKIVLSNEVELDIQQLDVEITKKAQAQHWV